MADDMNGLVLKVDEAVDDTTANLLRLLYISEVYSAETFSCMLATYDDLTVDQRRKLEAARRLEVAMAGRLFKHLTHDLGRNIRPPSRARQIAESLANLPHGTWFERMTDLESGSIRGVMGFRALKSAYGHQEPRLCALLLAHEMALRDFARDELDGETTDSINRILALLSPEDRAAIEAYGAGDSDARAAA